MIDLEHLNSVRTLVSPDAHVDTFSWSHDSTSIIYHLLSHSDAESTSQPVTEAIVSIDTGAVRHTFTHPSLPGRPTVWRSSEDLIFLQNRSSKLLSSRALWLRDVAGSAPVHLAYGDNEDALHIVNLNTKSQYATQVASGLQSRIEVFDADNKSFIAFETNEEDIGQWDMKLLDDGHYVFVAVRSSAVHGEPLDIWSGKTQYGMRGSLATKLSSHHTWLSPRKVPVTQPFYWTASDGQSLQGVISYPKGVELRKLPTVVVPHGGPTAYVFVSCVSDLCFINFVRRDTLHLSFGKDFILCQLEVADNFYRPEDWSWRHFLASNGYLVFSPNYRGSKRISYIRTSPVFVHPWSKA